MNEPEIRKADVSTKLELPMYDAIAEGAQGARHGVTLYRDVIRTGITA